MKGIPSLLIALAIAAPFRPASGQQIYPVPDPDPEIGFVSIFDGETLDGWEGDSTYWRVEDGALVGEVTPETILDRNTFIIWRGGTTADFELKVEYLISAEGNSGINYRSIEVPDVPLALQGYQADIDGAGRWTGQNYEERGRTFLAMRGQFSEVRDGAPALVRASLGDPDSLWAYVRQNDWNEYHLIARGNVLIHILNGHVMSTVIDADAERARAEGLLGVQVHVGPPMTVAFRNMRLKRL